MRVDRVMTHQIFTVRAEAGAWEAAEMLVGMDLTGLPVVGPDRRVLGLITELDLIRAMREGKDPRDLTVREVMSPRPIFVEPETSIDEAAELMDEYGVRRLPVCRDGRLVGIISRGDLLRAMLLRCVEHPRTPEAADPC